MLLSFAIAIFIIVIPYLYFYITLGRYINDLIDRVDKIIERGDNKW